MNNIEKYLLENSIEYEIRDYSNNCNSAEEAAREIKFPYNQIYKSMLCKKGDLFILAVIPAKSKLDSLYILANPDLVKSVTGYNVGSVSPLLIKNKIEVYIDSSICKFSKVGVGCGEYGKELIISTKELIRLTSGTVLNRLAL